MATVKMDANGYFDGFEMDSDKVAKFDCDHSLLQAIMPSPLRRLSQHHERGGSRWILKHSRRGF